MCIIAGIPLNYLESGGKERNNFWILWTPSMTLPLWDAPGILRDALRENLRGTTCIKNRRMNSRFGFINMIGQFPENLSSSYNCL